MTRVPIIPHHRPTPEALRSERPASLARELVREEPALVPGDWMRPLQATRLDDRAALHLDDLSTISLLDRHYDVTYLEDRARFRAYAGDLVASCSPHEEVFERYCREHLGLEPVRWLHPSVPRAPLRVASACWRDRPARRAILRALRGGELAYLHPHMGNFPVWAAAGLLRRATRRPLQVIAPHPALTERVNDKLWFARCVARLFGTALIPPTAEAGNLATLATLLRELAPDARSLVIKQPDSGGGAGNLVLAAERFRGRGARDIRGELRELLRPLNWRGQCPLLVGRWEADVLGSPSAQLWIPPEEEGGPLVEGLFEQIVEGEEGLYVGSRPARLTSDLEIEMVDRAWLLGRTFQRLGYVGRCSFDMLLVGRSLDRCRLELLECNGRWGGASLPMTLMNRLFGDWTRRPYATRELSVPGLEDFGFEDLLRHFAADLYDARTGTGSLVLYNPGGLRSHAEIDVLALGQDVEQATRAVSVDVPARLERLVARRAARPERAHSM